MNRHYRQVLNVFRLFLVVIVYLAASHPAKALPSYARQTGQECAACHNGFPELTPYGRLFKLNGYVFGGGRSSWPPLAAMMVDSFTHTEAPQIGGAAPHFGDNNNAAFEFASVFYGGAIASNWGIGAFIQSTYNNVSQRYSWDNTDIRWAHASMIDDSELVYGVSLNNNPSVSDVWNTTPAWRFPFQSSGLAPGLPAQTLIEGGLAGQVLGLNPYFYWDRQFYGEIGVYRTLSMRMDTSLGVDPTGSSSVDGQAYYWRAAWEPQWDRNSLEIGTFGLQAAMIPGRVTGMGTDSYTDIGVDSQYQFLAERNSLSVSLAYIHELQSLGSSFAAGNASNPHDTLNSLTGKVSYFFDQTYGVIVSPFRISGSADAILYGGSSVANVPNTNGFITELDYIPFNHDSPTFWQGLNVKFGLQYVYWAQYNGGSANYDGNGANAKDNNTVYFFIWTAF
jgi:hypothetical protein